MPFPPESAMAGRQAGWSSGLVGWVEDPCPGAVLTKVGKALSWAAPVSLASLSTPEEPCVPSRWDHLAHFKLKWVEGLEGP